jgi:hypothetical protein
MRSVWAANEIAVEFEYTRDPLFPAAASNWSRGVRHQIYSNVTGQAQAARPAAISRARKPGRSAHLRTCSEVAFPSANYGD